MSDTITYGGVKFIRHTETYEVRKGKIDTIQYYTRINTGESGMSLRGLANACGISDKSLRVLFKETTIFEEVRNKLTDLDYNELNLDKKEVRNNSDIYLIQSDDDVHVIRDIFCERVIYYYAFESNYKKTKAKELYQTLAQHGLRVFIQSKTGYQAEQATQYDNSLALSIDEQLKRKIEELELKLVNKEEQLIEQAEEIRKLKYQPVYEKTHQAYLHGLWGGIREFHVGSPYPGRIDLVTDQMVVEVKRVANFEIAFGQLLRYRAQLQETIYATKTYMLYLFGDVTDDERRILQAMAKLADFQLMIECNLKDYMDANEMSNRDRLHIVISNEDASVA